MDTKLIKLTKGKFAIVDAEDFEWLNQWKWHFEGRYAFRKKWFSHTEGVSLPMHKEILKKHGIEIDEKETDHINGNGLDNRKGNLRACTHAENMRNMKKTKLKGISFREGLKKPWRARLMKDYKEIQIGYFETKEEAAKAYNEAIKGHFGEFASFNQI